MNDQSLVYAIFEAIKKADSKSSLIESIIKLKFGYTERGDDKSYPRISFSISPKDILDIAKDIKVSSLIEFGTESNATGLEKLLLAMAWKQNDLKKLKGIIEGINSTETDPDGKNLPLERLVFYYFGRHLVNPIQYPIIDQHVIRAFAVFHASTEKVDSQTVDINYWLKKNSLAAKNGWMIQEYLNWYSKWKNESSALKAVDDYNQKEFLAEVDFVLMQVGKKIKMK